MKATIHLDIGASFLVATLRPALPGRGRRLASAVGRKLQQWRKPARAALAASLPAEETRAGAVTEIASWTPTATRAENITALLEAAAQALQALRARHTAPLDGCRLVVRTGVSASYVGITPMDFSSPSARSGQQLRLVAKALAHEALGTEAAGHEVRWSIQADQAHLCVITLESALIAGVQALAQAQRMKLVSCQPALVELLDSELEKSRRQHDTRTLMWTELNASGHRHPNVTFIRLGNGSTLNAWRTVTRASSAAGDPWLHPALDRFLIASGAAGDEQVVPCAWPAHTVGLCHYPGACGMNRLLVESPFEFAPGAARYRPLSWAILAVGACAALSGLYLMSQASAQLEDQRARQAKISKQQSTLNEQMRKAESNPDMLEKAKARRQLEALLQTPWSLMFEALEAAADTVEGRVTLLSMVPSTANPASRKIELTLMASSYPSMLAYTEALSTVSGFSDVRIASHQFDERGSPATFRFRVAAGWNHLNEGVFLAKEPAPLAAAEISASALKPGIGKAPSP